MGCESTDDGFIAFLEGTYAFPKFLIFALALFLCAPAREFSFVLDVRCRGGGRGRAGREACTESTIFLLEFCDPAFEVSEVGFAAVAGILCSDAVAVGAGLPALFG